MKRLICCLMMLMLALPYYPAGGEEKKSTTVMVYMCGSNLESQYGLATRDIAEMMGSGLDRFSTNVVIMTGGASSWASPSLPSDQVGIHQIRGNSLYTLWQGEQRSMGEGETLALLLNTAYEKFHTDQYVLILWNHGGGPIQGVCWDENFDKDSLQIPELIAGIEKSPFKERKLDLIGFDACLMGSVETAWQLSDYAELMIASEETEPGGGWDYSFLGGMEKEEITATGRRIIDLYVDTAHQAQGAHLTLSMIDLSRMDQVIAAMDRYFSGLHERMDDTLFQHLSGLRYNAQGFGRDWRADSSADYDLVDVGSLLDSFRACDAPAAEEMRTALNDAILYHGAIDEGSTGLSLYFPYFNGQAYREWGKAAYEKLNFCPGYLRFIDAFQHRMAGEAGADWRNLIPEVEKEGDGFQISLQLTQAQKEQLVSARLMIFESNFSIGSANAFFDQVYVSGDVNLSDGGLLSAPYRNEGLVFEFHTEDGMIRRSTYVPFTLLDSGEYRLEVMAANLKPDYVREAKDDEPGVSHRMQFILSPSEEDGDQLEISGIQVWDSMTNTFTTRSDDRPENYEYLYLISDLRMITREDDLILPYGKWNTHNEFDQSVYSNHTALTDSQWYFYITRELSEVCYAAFEITDIYNHTFTTEIVPLRPEKDVLIYHAPLQLSDPPLQIDCKLLAAAPHRVRLYVELTNPTDQLYGFQIENIFLNGDAYAMEENGVSGALQLVPPGKMSSAPMQFSLFVTKDEAWNVLHTLESIRFDLALYEGRQEKYLGTVENITLQPHFPLLSLPQYFQ